MTYQPSSRKIIRVGTRESQLAMVQTKAAIERLSKKMAGVNFEIVPIATHGDKVRNKPIAEIGSQGVFVKELEDALLERRIDLVVHSLKDLPTDLPCRLFLSAIFEREDPRDVLISTGNLPFAKLPKDCKIATSSRRRSAQLKALRPDLQFVDIRGNVPTRLRKHQNGECDAIILAAAGLIRLNLTERITEFLDVDTCTPAPGQGALALECRSDDQEMIDVAKGIDDSFLRVQVECERAFLKRLGGGCSVPIGALATINDGILKLTGCVASYDGKRVLRHTIEGELVEAKKLAGQLAKSMLEDGAAAILNLLIQAPAAISPP